ncbi:Aminomethyltransferase (glycine cleavage system T protein) [hydrothermal vent metagenome]|uniref:aminomethyltransferase n=1 Tax=hydrothermal vent metagenome TaxID=652676 RepID=A0A1W1CJR7_9ZZZZ
MKKTILNTAHIKAEGKMVDFGGWDMPLNYGSQIKEHNIVRESAGMFDVSHMSVVDVKGKNAKEFLQKLIANDVAKLKTIGKALYSCMLTEAGGVIDDLIVYFFSEENYRLVINAGTTEKDLAWIDAKSHQFEVSITPREDLAIIAVQGPKARELTYKAIGGTEEMASHLKPFEAVNVGDLMVARTGYTGEDGFEIMLPEKSAEFTWEMLLEAGVKPCGLGARDTLRLEAGMALYGNEMNEETSPLDAGLKWTVDLKDKNRDFFGRKALENHQSQKKLVGLVLESKGVLRAQQKVITPFGEGVITSGSFSPTMNKSIAFASVPIDTKNEVEIEIRKNKVKAKVVQPPFVRNNKVFV